MDTLQLKGKIVSESIRSALSIRVDSLSKDGIIPQLAAILIGDDPASQVYVRNKTLTFEKQNCKSNYGSYGTLD